MNSTLYLRLTDIGFKLLILYCYHFLRITNIAFFANFEQWLPLGKILKLPPVYSSRANWLPYPPKRYTDWQLTPLIPLQLHLFLKLKTGPNSTRLLYILIL